VRDALKRWRFKPTVQEYMLAVTISFELDDKSACTDETKVSADLPDRVYIILSPPCVNVEVN
jgi:hypothetical protein